MIRPGWTARRPALVVAAIVLVAFVATAVYAVPLERFHVMPDELTYLKAALAVWDSPPLLGQGSDWFVSWSQLLPVAYSLPLGATSTVLDGLRLAHLIGALAMALTAVPAYLLALEVTRDRRAAYLVALLCVSVPWMAMAGALMTEVFAYPAFTWAAWAAVRACTRPGPRADAHALAAALVAFFARSQLVFVPIALLVAIGLCVARTQGRLRDHRVLLGAGAVVATVVAARLLFGGGLSGVLGAYASLEDARSISPAIAGRLVAYVGIAVAAAPLIVGLPWIMAGLASRERRELAFAAFSATTIVFVVLQSALELTQPGRLHDRYLLYALPLLFTAMAAALVADRRRLVGATIVTGVLFALLVSRYDFFEAGAELPSLSFTLHDAINQLAFSFDGLDPGWFLAGLTLAVTALLAIVLHERPRQALLLVTLPVLAYCAVETGSAYRQLTKAGYTFGYVEPRPRDWIDRIVPPGTKVAALVAQAGDRRTTPLAWWGVGFWNKSVARYYLPPTGDRPPTYSQPSPHTLALDASGHPLDTRAWWVVSTRDPHVRIAGGRPIARIGAIELRQVSAAMPLRVLVR